MRNFPLVAKQSEEILFLPVNEICDIIGCDELNVKSEELIWEFVLKWIEQDIENRKKHIVILMKQIRLGLMDTQFFLENVRKLKIFI